MATTELKVGLVLLSLAWVGWAAPQEGYSYPTPGGGGVFPSGSGSGSSQYPSAPAQYTFQWDVSDSPSGNFFGHGEQRESDDTQGKYYVQLPDGRRMVAEYYVDAAGFHPNVYFEGEITAGGGGQGQYGQGQGGGRRGGGGGGGGQYSQGGAGGGGGGQYSQGGAGGGGGQGQGQAYPPSGPGPSPGLPLPSQSYGAPSK